MLIIVINTYAQTDTIKSKIPEIELPDFVITGRATIELPAQKKSSPELISPLSREFILPKIKIQELGLEGLSDPAKQQPSIGDTSIKYSGKIKSTVSLYSLPALEAFYSGRIDKYKFSAGGDFEKSRDFEKNSRYLKSSLYLNNTLIIKKDFQAPARLNLSGYFNYFNYSNFKAFSSDTFNTIVDIQLKGELENLFYREFNLNVGGKLDYQNQSRWNYSFAEMGASGTLKSTFEHFELTACANPFIYKVSKDNTKNSLVLAAYGELYFRKLFNTVNIISRLDYQSEKENGNQFIAPSARVGIGLSDFWTLTIYYENKLINKTPITLWKENPYLDSSAYNYSIERIKNKFGFGTIIYFDRTSNFKFELSRYNIAGKTIFVVDTTNYGFFLLNKQETEAFDINSFLFLDLRRYGELLIHLRYLHSRLKITTRDEPHTPKFQSRVSYGYRFEFPLSLYLSFSYNSLSYGDINLIKRIEPVMNLDLSLDYLISRYWNVGLELNNLLNKKNFKWYNYNQKPFDILLYVKTRF